MGSDRTFARNHRSGGLGGLDVDANGRLHLLLSSYGVVRLDGDELTQMTPAWPRGARGEQLILEDDTAIIATASSGVLLWKLGTTEARRVELAG